MDASDRYEAHRMPSAAQDFRAARQRAALQELLARLRGQSAGLLAYDEVVRHVRPIGSADRGLKDIPLDAIAGSVGRARDYTRDFLPRHDTDKDRWTRVRLAFTNPAHGGLPPISVYQIGEAYFVIDGHHRISVARELGATHIQAYVTEVRAQLPLAADARPEDLILLQEGNELLERTRLDQTRPGAELRVTQPGASARLLQQMEHTQREMERSTEPARHVSMREAAAAWHDGVYQPIVGTIREMGLMRLFPGKTETDIYLLVSEHRAALEEALGGTIRPEVGASDLAARENERQGQTIVRAGRRLLRALTPDELRTGPKTGRWRESKLAARYSDRLFADLLVPVSGEPQDWHALDLALEVAKQEQAHIHGLLTTASAGGLIGDEADAMRNEFDRRCRAAGVPSAWVVEAGETAAAVCRRAALADLLVLGVPSGAATRLTDRVGASNRKIIKASPRPVLVVPRAGPRPTRVLLAYNDSPKAHEALFVAAYLGEAWGASLTVLSVQAPGQPAGLATHAREYLQMHELQATYIERGPEPVATTILLAAEEHASELVVMGGYSVPPVLRHFNDNVVELILRESRRAVLICR